MSGMSLGISCLWFRQTWECTVRMFSENAALIHKTQTRALLGQCCGQKCSSWLLREYSSWEFSVWCGGVGNSFTHWCGTVSQPGHVPPPGNWIHHLEKIGSGKPSKLVSDAWPPYVLSSHLFRLGLKTDCWTLSCCWALKSIWTRNKWKKTRKLNLLFQNIATKWIHSRLLPACLGAAKVTHILEINSPVLVFVWKVFGKKRNHGWSSWNFFHVESEENVSWKRIKMWNEKKNSWKRKSHFCFVPKRKRSNRHGRHC